MKTLTWMYTDGLFESTNLGWNFILRRTVDPVGDVVLWDLSLKGEPLVHPMADPFDLIAIADQYYSRKEA